jgi:hypothetical protein
VTDELEVALAVARALESLGVPYFVGGSLASSLQGEPRSTNDIDLIVDLPESQVEAFAEALGVDFDVDIDALRNSMRQKGSWNIFHTPLVLKIDLFAVGTTDFDRSEMDRRRRTIVRDDGAALAIKSPEDTILRKLLWYRESNEVLGQQWRDVLGVLRVSGPLLDGQYLEEWSARIGVAELLGRARAEATGGAAT